MKLNEFLVALAAYQEMANAVYILTQQHQELSERVTRLEEQEAVLLALLLGKEDEAKSSIKNLKVFRGQLGS